MPLVSIVIPTYNHLEDLLKPCLTSVLKYTDLTDTEIIVIANGCTDGTEDYIYQLPVRLINSKERLGYTKATNVGIKAAEGQYVVLLNNDTVILDFCPKHKWIEMLLAPFSDPKVGITGVREGYDKFSGENFFIFFCVMLRKKVLEEIGYLDESYSPGGGEDTSACIEIRKLGYTSVVVPFKNTANPNTGAFPIWHKAEGTFNDKEFPEYSRQIVKDNSLKNMLKYNRNIRLNIGSADIKVPGFISVDKYDNRSDIIADAFDLNLPDDSVAEIMAIHFLEHISPYRVKDLLTKWHKMLKPGGKLVMEMPNIEEICAKFGETSKGNRYGLLTAIYGALNTTGVGDPGDITSPHLYGWYPEMLQDHLIWTGYKDITFGPEQFPHQGFNFRVEAYKK